MITVREYSIQLTDFPSFTQSAGRAADIPDLQEILLKEDDVGKDAGTGDQQDRLKITADHQVNEAEAWAVSSVLSVSDESRAVRLRGLLEFCEREVFVG